MTWWDSFDTLSKLQTALAILVSILGFATLTIKLRADHIKKRTDARRVEERVKLDKELETKTAEALRATAALEAKQAPRRFTNPQIAAMQQVLDAFPRRPKIMVWYRQPDPEAWGFADHIATIVTNVGYKEGTLNGMWDKPMPAGLTLNSSHPDPELVNLFARAFAAAGVALPSQPLDASADAPILCVGWKQ